MMNELKRPYVNSFKAKSLFEDQYGSYMQFGNHFEFTDMNPYKGRLYLDKGNMDFNFNYDTEQWELQKFKVYEKKLKRGKWNENHL